MRGLERAQEVVAKLRGENGCPWDKAQTHESLRRYLLEETYETLEALDQLASDPEHGSEKLKEELGDVLLQVLLHAEIAGERGAFDIDSLANALADKLIRRHPHVFGGEKVATAEQVVSAWEKNKQKENPRNSVLDGIPAGLPALQHSLKVIEKVSKVGFQWPNLEGPLDKVQEELGEFLAEVKKLGPAKEWERSRELGADSQKKLEAELGDLLFSLANIAHFLRLNPEDSLRAMLGRFGNRFRHVEKRAKETGRSLDSMSLEEMDLFWNEAKAIERS